MSTTPHTPRENFDFEGHPAFIISPANKIDGEIPWVWYAPSFGTGPGTEMNWMFEKLRDNGIAIVGLDVGESFGSPTGRAAFEAFYQHLVQKKGFAKKTGLLPRSRGGLMLYNWAAEHADAVACIAGIYTVCDLRSYPGLEKACGAYKMSATELKTHLAEHNPVDRLAPLARAYVPILHIHGVPDTVVPYEENAAEPSRRYRALGGEMNVITIQEYGHDMWSGWFENRELAEFLIRHAKARNKDK